MPETTEISRACARCGNGFLTNSRQRRKRYCSPGCARPKVVASAPAGKGRPQDRGKSPEWDALHAARIAAETARVQAEFERMRR